MSALAARQETQPAEQPPAGRGAPAAARQSFDLLVVFQLAGQCFGLLASNVREIIHIRQTTRVPNTARHVEGVVNLRGRIVPVFSLSRKLDLAIAAQSAPPVVTEEGLIDFEPGAVRRTVMVVEEEGGLAGLLVEQVTDVVKISMADIDLSASAVEKKGSGFVWGTITLEGDRLVTLLHLEALLAD